MEKPRNQKSLTCVQTEVGQTWTSLLSSGEDRVVFLPQSVVRIKQVVFNPAVTQKHLGSFKNSTYLALTESLRNWIPWWVVGWDMEVTMYFCVSMSDWDAQPWLVIIGLDEVCEPQTTEPSAKYILACSSSPAVTSLTLRGILPPFSSSNGV